MMTKNILITGASTGFGALMAKTLSDKGHNVLATMRNIRTTNANAANKLKLEGIAEVLELDVTDDESVQVAVQTIVDKYGRIDVLINNAAVHGGGLLEGYSIQQFQRIMDVNVLGVLRLYHHVLPVMRKQHEGLVINISSSAGRVSLPYQVPYNASKFALEGLTEGSYHELLEQGIETVLIEPGAFLTELYSKSGVHSDRPGILEAYGDKTINYMDAFGSKFHEILMRRNPDLHLVSDAVVDLVEMQKGDRPLRTTVDPIANKIDIEYLTKTAEIQKRWKSAYFNA